MGVHYDRGSIGRIRRAGLRPATIDIGGGVTFQGGISQVWQSRLLAMIPLIQAEQDAAFSELEEREARAIAPDAGHSANGHEQQKSANKDALHPSAPAPKGKDAPNPSAPAVRK